MDELARWRAAARRRVADTADGKDSTGDNDGSAPAVQGGGQGGGGGSANVMVLAATNAPEAVDAAFLRPGRFDEVRDYLLRQLCVPGRRNTTGEVIRTYQ